MLISRDIHKSYAHLQVLKGIDLHVKPGEIVSIVGSSGAGKSTLLHILGALDTPDKGSVMINDKSIFDMAGKSLAKFRNKHIGFVFQFHNLLPEFDALDNVCMPAYIGSNALKESRKKGLELLDLLGLEDRAKHKPSELSGGEQQRVSVARALVNSPSIVFADEPSGNLDSKNARELHRLFFDLRKTLNQTFVIVTHNQELADMADRKLEIVDGKIL